MVQIRTHYVNSLIIRTAFRTKFGLKRTAICKILYITNVYFSLKLFLFMALFHIKNAYNIENQHFFLKYTFFKETIQIIRISDYPKGGPVPID